MTTRRIMTIHDDQVGEGVNLSFPSMSTCAAVILVLDTTLIGIHKTMGWAPVHTRLCADALAMANGRAINRLYIGGWGMGTQHNPAQIRTELGCDGVRTYTARYNNTTLRSAVTGNNSLAFRSRRGAARTTNVCTFAFFNGPNAAPRVGLKRSTKVNVTIDPGRFDRMNRIYGQGNGGRFASVETVETPSNNLHNITFTRLA